MTASSVEFFPCRVQLMGLSRSASTSSTATNLVNHNETANLQNAPSRPQLATIRGVSRNLFGAPDPGEINNIYQEEAERQRSYILQRYNFDIKTTKPTSQQNASQPTDSLTTTSTSTTTIKHTQLPTLIEQELKQHEQRLQTEQLNLNRSSDNAILSKSKILNDSCSGSKIMRGCSKESLSTMITFASERQKPYSRQSLLTDNFNLRKNNISWTSHCTKTNAKMITLKSGIHSHHNIEILQLPQALQAHEEASNLKEEQKEDHTKVTTANDEKNVVDDCNSSSSSSNNCSNCTALSLKVVVSSQDSSSTTTSDASNAHTHHA